MPRTRSPGERVLTIAASSPPEPDAVRKDLALGPEVGPDPAVDPIEDRGELGPAVVDHLASAHLANRLRQAGRAGDSKVGFVRGHVVLLG